MTGGAFVGRATELEVLLRVVGQCARGEAVAALVTGEPGSGKTRLFAEPSVFGEVVPAVRAAGHQPERGVPLAALSGLLKWLGQSGAEGTRLNELLFETTRLEPLDPLRVFEATHRAISALDQPLLLVVDDLQWVDALSVALCHYLLRAARDTKRGLAVVAAARPSRAASEFAESVTNALAPNAVTIVELGGLARGEGIELGRLIAPSLSDEGAAALWERANGSPFWLEVLARRRETGTDAGELVRIRLAGASADAEGLLALLTVAARPLASNECAAIQDWTLERLEFATDELVARGLVAHAHGALRPAHDLIREATFFSMASEARVGMHRRLAAWLEEDQSDDLQLQLQALAHRRASGLPTLALAARIASSPSRRLLGNTGLYELEKIACDAELRDEHELSLDAGVASLAAELASYELAIERWLKVAERSTDSELAGTAFVAAARAAYELGRTEVAERLLDQAALAAPGNAIIALEAVAERAVVRFQLNGQTTEACMLAHDAARRARALAPSREDVSGLETRGRRACLAAFKVEMTAAWSIGDRKAEAAALAEALHAATTLDEEAHLTVSLMAAQYTFSSERVRQIRDRAHRELLPRIELDAGVCVVGTLLSYGQLLEAETAAEEIRDLAARIPDGYDGRQRLPYFGCLIALYRGNWRAGLEALERAAAAEPSARLRINFHYEYVHWLARIGGAAEKDAVLARLAEAAGLTATDPTHAAHFRLARAECLARVGCDDNAREALLEWDQQHVPALGPWQGLRRDAVGALLLLRSGQLAAAIAELERIVACFDEGGMALEAVWTQLDLGRAMAEIDRKRAAETFRAAAAAASARGATTLVDVAEHELRSLGVRTWHRTRASSEGQDPLAAFTERERAIALLIAEGASNPEIAKRLFLSRKTVERHVSNALAKAGVRNRAELAAHVTKLGQDEPLKH
jgi:DNA-binding CsgD family transcriptional regulator